ncbi:Mss4-like protein [Aspergillus alliaceus]|uniref:Mss4-like protein n=1 Tax=Petromyces alliaceus TaxID=209559 RepID=A0A5N7C041_PETAA|nr:Mss4-like protein [Aspergillus alliaceus]
MAATIQSRTLTAACHCRSVHFTICIPESALPLKIHLCHCTVCRYTHGSLCSFHAPLPEDIQPQFIAPSNLDGLTPYAHPKSSSTRYFCRTCGCHVGDRQDVDGRWVVSSAIFDPSGDESVWQITSHIHAGAGSQDGLFHFLSQINGRELTRSTSTLDDLCSRSPVENIPKLQRSADQQLHASCHCGGVTFDISRPREDFVNDPGNRKWILPGRKDKWLGVFDVCDTCRLVSGANVAAWMFVPLDHISPSPPNNLLIGSSKRYSSSEGVVRTFCGTCGAVVFYSCADRPEIADVAVGILRDPESVLAEGWITWRTGRIAYLKDGMKYDEGFTKELDQGLQAWGREKYGKVELFDVA